MIINQDHPSNLFDRLPKTIFRPLAGQSNRITWEVLESLYETYFGPSGDIPGEYGVPITDLATSVEALLERAGGLVDDETGEASSTPLNQQAYYLINRLVDCKWIREERVGVRNFYSMHPDIVSLYESLSNYLAEGPQQLAGRMQVIANQVRQAAFARAIS